MRIVMNSRVLGAAVLCGLVFLARAADAGTINFSSLSQGGSGATNHGSGFVVDGFVFSSSYPLGDRLLT